VDAPNRKFPVAEARRLVDDLFEPKGWIYWPDFLLSAGLGWSAFTLAIILPAPSWQWTLAILVSGFGLFRAVIFIHELTHLRKDLFGPFRFVWNLVCGIPLMVPSFTYMGVHIDHHKQKIYGTRYDGEYYPYILTDPKKMIKSVAMTFILPFVFILRFAVIFPISYLKPSWRRYIWQNASSLAEGPDYKRPFPTPSEARVFFLQEFLASVVAWTGIILMAKGIWPLRLLLVWYLTAMIILFTNSLRTLVAHCYRNGPDNVLEFGDQFLDSVNVPGNSLITPLWAPVGLRFHGVHHLFPGIPYHNLGKAHRRLAEKLSDKELYMTTCRSGLWAGIAQLWREAKEAEAKRAQAG